jgi:hypothetical protein
MATSGNFFMATDTASRVGLRRARFNSCVSSLVGDLHRTRQRRHPRQDFSGVRGLGVGLGVSFRCRTSPVITADPCPVTDHASTPNSTNARSFATEASRDCGSTGQLQACPATHDQLRARPEPGSYRAIARRFVRIIHAVSILQSCWQPEWQPTDELIMADPSRLQTVGDVDGR